MNAHSTLSIFGGIAAQRPHNLRRYLEHEILKDAGEDSYAVYAVMQGIVRAIREGTQVTYKPGEVFNCAWLVGNDTKPDQDAVYYAVGEVTVLTLTQDECREDCVKMALIKALALKNQTQETELLVLSKRRLQDMTDLNAFMTHQASVEAAYASFRERVLLVINKFSDGVFPTPERREKCKEYFRQAFGWGTATSEDVDRVVGSIVEDDAPPSSGRGKTLIGPRPGNAHVLGAKPVPQLPPAAAGVRAPVSVGRLYAPVTGKIEKGKTMRWESPPPRPPQK